MKKLFLLPFVFIWACSSDSEREITGPEIVAEAEIYGLYEIGLDEFETRPQKIGNAKFVQIGTVVTIEISLFNMTPNSEKAVHIHDGTVNRPGRHWNSGKFVAACDEESLGKAWTRPFIGDVGNVPIDENGNGTFTLQTDLWAINSGGEKDILDKAIIVHQQPQDFVEECDPFHTHDYPHSNQKIGGGTIELVSEITRNVRSVVSTEQMMPDFLICK